MAEILCLPFIQPFTVGWLTFSAAAVFVWLLLKYATKRLAISCVLDISMRRIIGIPIIVVNRYSNWQKSRFAYRFSV